MPLDGSEFKFEIDETTKLLIAARGMVERGWCQNKIAIGGQVCAVGALTRTVSAFGDPLSAFGDGVLHRAMRHLERAIGGVCIPSWNDMRERTQADVLKAYDIAIEASLSGRA